MCATYETVNECKTVNEHKTVNEYRTVNECEHKTVVEYKTVNERIGSAQRRSARILRDRRTPGYARVRYPLSL